MKKSTKTTASNKVQSPRANRHSSTKKKPVTIDLKAEKVSSTEAATSNPKKSGAAKTSVPKTASSSKAKAASPEKNTSANTTNQQSAPATGFGRNAGKATENTTDTKANNRSSAKVKPISGEKKSAGRINQFATALLGGIVALGGAGLLQYSGILASPASNQMSSVQQSLTKQNDTLQAELADVKSRLLAAEKADSSSVDAQQISSLVKQEVSARLSNNSATAGDTDLDAVITQLNETTVRVESLLSEHGKVTKQVEALQSAIKKGGAGGGAAVSALNVQIDNLTAQIQNSGAEIQQLQTNFKALAQQNNSESEQAASALTERVAILESGIKDLPQITISLESFHQGLENNSRSLQQQNEQLNGLIANLNRADSSEKLAARAVAAAALKNDIDQGRPFAESLAILQKFATSQSNLEPLTEFAQSGVPTAAELSKSFGNVSEAILTATAPKPANDLTSKLLAGVKSFVKVKARKPLEGSSPLALVSQISDALTKGNLEGAAARWSELPADGQTVSKPWHDQLQSRITTNRLISSSIQSFLTSTATQ